MIANNIIGGERKKVKVVLQDGMKDCGICCLLSIIRFYGGEVSKEYLREATHTTKEGVSLYNLIECSEKLGFEATGVTGNIEEINVNNLPCIAHFVVNKNYKHFVVLYQIHKKKQLITIMDPAKGKKVISFSEFRLLTSSNYLFLSPIKPLPIMKKKNKILKQIRLLLRDNKTMWFSIILLTIVYFILNLIGTFHLKYLMEFAISYQISNNVYWISSLLLCFYFLKNINQFLRNILLNKWTSIFDYETTSMTYKQILLLPYLYYKNRTTGEVVSRFKDLNTIRSFISSFFCVITTDCITLILFIYVMFVIQKKITFILLILMSSILFLSILINTKKKENIKKIVSGQDTINSYIINGISNVDTMKGSHLEKRMIDKFKLNYKSFMETVYHYSLIIEIYQFIKNNIQDLMITIIYGIGSIEIIKDNLSISNLILYQTAYSYFKNSFSNLLSLIEEYTSFKIALNRVEEIYLISHEKFKNNYYYLPYQLIGDIEIKNLNYKINNKVLFQNLNVTIKQGERVLLCGASGSGKSTLLKMLLRYIDINYGHISIAGIDINHYHLENIRSYITYVTGNEYLFTDNLQNNIMLYKEISEEKFQTACKICLVDELVKNKLTKYNTIVEENGFNFSNGERQRIILARSILRNSNIYIFDESFSGLDINKEKKILENIFQYLKGKTIIVISHRFNNKKLFDRILKLDQGNLYENP